MAKKKIGVVLSGAGCLDGAEIHEAVLTLLAIDEAGAEAAIFAPDISLAEVDHIDARERSGVASGLHDVSQGVHDEISSAAHSGPMVQPRQHPERAVRRTSEHAIMSRPGNGGGRKGSETC